LKFAGGSQWWALTRACVAHCVATAADPKFCAPFNFMFAPDEIFFHTIVHNSPFAAGLRLEPYSDTRRDGIPAKYWNLHHLTAYDIATAEQATAALALSPRRLFARKFSSSNSAAALAVIDEAIGVAGQAASSRPAAPIEPISGRHDRQARTRSTAWQ
jgi:hypothetical protein